MKETIRTILAYCISKLPPGILTDVKYFRLYQDKGIHITPVHFYQPVPDTRDLECSSLWDSPSELPGIINELEPQLEFLKECSVKWFPEYMSLLTKNPTWKKHFSGVDGALLYSMIRKYQPNRVVEVGSGGSTLISAAALRKNNQGRIVAIDPYPRMEIRSSLEGLGEVVEERVELLPLSFFGDLQANDILFIDSSHTVRIGGDVVYEICEIIPRLKPGVIVHLHDIFLPKHYPREWVLKRNIFWAEQYLLQAFLAHNNEWKIIWSAGTIHTSAPDKLKGLFAEYDPASSGPGSFWMVRSKRGEH